MKRSVFDEIRNALAEGRNAYLHLEADGHTFVRRFQAKQRLIILGGGHIAVPAAKLGALLDFAVTVVDDRPSFAEKTRFPEAKEVICDAFDHAIASLQVREHDFVCVITRGHRHDADCLRAILSGTRPWYLGMIGSKRRVIELLNLLEGEGFDRAELDRIHAPIGIPLAASTPEEIAVSIAAELINERSAMVKSEPQDVLERTDPAPEVIGHLAETTEPCALLTVISSRGSTPVKSGSVMVTDQISRIWGTIGGGCSESAVLEDARRIIGTGQKRVIEIDMSNDVAESEGMVCGGHMQVLIEDVII